MKSTRFLNLLQAAPRSLLIEILVAGVVLEILALSVPIFTQVLFDKVIVHSSLSTLNVLTIGVLLVISFEGILIYLYSRHIHHLSAIIDEFLTQPVINKLLDLPLNYFESRPKGEIASHMRDISEIRQGLSVAYITGAIDIIFMVFVLLFIFLYNPILAAVVAICIPTLAILSLLLRPAVRSGYMEQSKRKDRFESLVSEGLNCIATIKNMALEATWRRRWLAAHVDFVRASLHAKKTAAIDETALRVLQRLVVLVVLWVGAMEVIANSMSFGQFIACYMLSIRVLAPSTRIFQIAMGITRTEEAKKHIDALLSERNEQTPHGKLKAFTPGDIIFDNVSFRYMVDQPDVLSRVNLRIPYGAYIGITGPSGSGKSTLSKLIQHHAVAHQGRVSIGDTDVSDIILSDLRRHVVLLTHDASLFHGTLLENIALDSEKSIDERFHECCRLSEVDSFLEELPRGLQTPVSERGTELSSGQRQRIALARALYFQPQVLILDEATNALDAQTEMTVLDNLREEFKNRTLIVVTHRTRALSGIDCLIEVKNGHALMSLPYSASHDRERDDVARVG